MAIKLEAMFNEIQQQGINTDKAITTSAALVSGSQTVTGTISSTSSVIGNSAGATTAAGNTTAAFKMGSASFGIYFGAGTPTISAAVGSIYLSSSGSAVNNRMYINTNGTTGWTAVSTVS